MREGFLWQWLVERDSIVTVFFAFLSRFAQFDEWGNQCKGDEVVRHPAPRSTLSFSVSFHPLKSKGLSPVLPSCHTNFNYLIGLQKQGKEWVLRRCHFPPSPGGYKGGHRWLGVIGEEWAGGEQHSEFHPLQQTSGWGILHPCWYCQLPLCCRELSPCWLISKF